MSKQEFTEEQLEISRIARDAGDPGCDGNEEDAHLRSARRDHGHLHRTGVWHLFLNNR